MDLPPPQPEVQQVVDVQQDKFQYKYPMPDEDSPEFIYWYYVLSRIDGPDVPENVKAFAYENNCIEVMKNYFWSDNKYKGGDVYSCGINGRLKFILVKDNDIRFAKWYEKKKLNARVFYN